MNQRLSKTDVAEIRQALQGLEGSALNDEVERQADMRPCSAKHIYSITADMRRGNRKTRSDKGRRKFDILPGTDTFEAAALVVGGAKLDPDQALLTARANGHDNLPSLDTMRRLLNEKGLNRKHRRHGRRNHRRFEAAEPLGIVQIDSTALKVRWQDIKTRRILRIEGIDKNHPQLDQGKIRVWQVMAVDDHSRRRFFRYIVTGHITSKDMVRFLCELSKEWGLAVRIYTDNGPEFKGFFAKAIKIINTIPAIRDSGGCEHFTHAPNNPQASGKVEVAHQWAEKMDRYIGLAEQKGIAVTADKLNGFADSICTHYNQVLVHRSTGETPAARWHGTKIVKRMLPAEVITSALLFDEAERVLTDTMTVRVGKVDYRIPARDEAGKASPFRVGMKLSVIAPHELEMIFVTMPDGAEYEVVKTIATPDVALDWKTAAPSEAEILTKTLKDHHAAKNKEARDLQKLTGEVYQVPHYNHDVRLPQTNVAHFPHPEIAITPEQIGEVVPVRSADTPVRMSAKHEQPLGGGTADADKSVAAPYAGKPITYWHAVGAYSDRFDGGKDEAKEFLERELFPGKTGELPARDVETAIARRHDRKEGLRVAS